MQVDQNGELGKEGRERESEILQNGERTEMRRGDGVGFKRGQHWLILTDGQNQHVGIFGYYK
jgi:hypothetical protein